MTSAVRDADNGAGVRRTTSRTSLRPRGPTSSSGDEEARLTYLGATSDTLDSAPDTIADLVLRHRWRLDRDRSSAHGPEA